MHLSRKSETSMHLNGSGMKSENDCHAEVIVLIKNKGANKMKPSSSQRIH